MNINRGTANIEQQLTALRRALSAGEITPTKLQEACSALGVPVPEDLRASFTSIATAVVKPQNFRATDGGSQLKTVAQQESQTEAPVAKPFHAMRERLDRALVGQGAAKATLMKMLREKHATIPDLLLVSAPYGAGKTAFVRSLAEAAHGGPDAYVTIDCSMLKNTADLATVFGAAPGYVGHRDERGAPTITEQVAKQKTKPLLVLDDVGAAAPEVQASLAARVAEWRSPRSEHTVEDADGRRASLKGGTIAVLGTDHEISAFQDLVKHAIKSDNTGAGAVTDRLKPARLVKFEAYSQEDYDKLGDYLLRDVSNQRAVTVSVSPEAKSALVSLIERLGYRECRLLVGDLLRQERGTATRLDLKTPFDPDEAVKRSFEPSNHFTFVSE